MKNLFTVLLIATLAIASSVAAQEISQANLAVDVPAPAAPSSETIVDAADASMDEALWMNDKHHHHKLPPKFNQCKPVIIALPIPESESECKRKCEAGCAGACDEGVEKCNAMCEPAAAKCNSDCMSADLACEKLCTGPGASDCMKACKAIEGDCEKACDKCEKTCTDACAAGGLECKKSSTDVDTCKEHCKPCEDVCEHACWADQTDCEAQCKNYIGSEQGCWGRCKRDCPAVCNRFCRRCNAESLAANAAELPATDATVSEQLQPIAPAPAAV